MDLSKIAKNSIKSVSTGEFCRLSAREISTLKPQFDANNVRLVGVGLEELGVEDFVKGDYFTGELYIDETKKCYKDLGYTRLNAFNLLPAIFAKKSRDAVELGKKENVPHDFKGDWWQEGGVLIVSAGGDELLLNYRQDNPAARVDTGDVLRALKIDKPSANIDGRLNDS